VSEENGPGSERLSRPRAGGDAVLIPLERELLERVSWLIRLRWAAGIGLVLGSLFGLPLLEFPVPFPLLTALGVAILGYNEILHLFGDRVAGALRSLPRSVHLQIALDWASLTALVYLTGGIRSPAAVGFVVHLIIGSLLLSRRACYLLAAAAVGLMAIMAPLTPRELLQPFEAGPAAGPAGGTLLELWVALTFLFTVTTYVATSITARLREKEAALARSERSIDRAYQGMASLYELGQRVNSTLNLDEVLTLIAQHATGLLGGRAASIRLLDRSGRTLSIAASHGLSRAYLDKGPVDVRNSGVDLVALEGRVVQVLEVAEDDRFQYRDEARREGLRSMLSCPMRARRRTLGVIRVYTGEPHRFDEQEQNLLMNLANLGAVAILNARSYGDLKALDEERVEFARTTHHQLRAPLAAVQSALDALAYAGPLSDTQADLVARARRRVQDAFETIRDLLDLAAAQRIAGAAPPSPARLDEALRRLVEGARDRCLAKRLDFHVELGPAPILVPMDRGDIERVFANLLDNAVKYTRSGSVGVRVAERDGWVEAIVEDTGIGIGREDLEHVFEGFFRGAAARESGEIGTGLGLSIVRQLVNRHGGTVGIDSAEGRGTRVLVRLPAARPPGGAEVGETVAAPAVSP
jgi:signal transduction histidine kinase